MIDTVGKVLIAPISHYSKYNSSSQIDKYSIPDTADGGSEKLVIVVFEHTANVVV